MATAAPTVWEPSESGPRRRERHALHRQWLAARTRGLRFDELRRALALVGGRARGVLGVGLASSSASRVYARTSAVLRHAGDARGALVRGRAAQLRRARARRGRRTTRPALVAVSEDEPTRARSRGRRCAARSARSPPRCASWAWSPATGSPPTCPTSPRRSSRCWPSTSLGAVWTSCAPDFGTAQRRRPARPGGAEGADRRRRLPLRRPRARPPRRRSPSSSAAMPSLPATVLVRSLCAGRGAAGGARRAGLRRAGRASRGSRRSSACPSTTRCGSCSPPAPPACRRGIVQGHGGILIEHLKALGLCLDLRAGRPLLLHQLDELDGVELPRRRPAARQATVVQYNGSPGPRRPRRALAGGGADRAPRSSAWAPPTPPAARRPASTLAPCERPARCASSSRPARRCAPAGWRWLHEQLGPRVRIDSISAAPTSAPSSSAAASCCRSCLGEISGRWLGVARARPTTTDGPADRRRGRRVRRSSRRCRRCRSGFWNDPDGSRYRAAYFDVFPGVWRQGDWITVTERGSDPRRRAAPTRRSTAPACGSARRRSTPSSRGCREVADSLVVGRRAARRRATTCRCSSSRRRASRSTTSLRAAIAARAAHRALAAARARRDRRRAGDPAHADRQEARGARSSASSRACPPSAPRRPARSTARRRSQWFEAFARERLGVRA